MRIKRDIGKGQLCTRGGVLLGILGGGVLPGSLNPDPISDRNMLFSIIHSRGFLENHTR